MTFKRMLAAALSALAMPSLSTAQADSGSIYYDNTWAGPVQAANPSLLPNTTSGFNLAEATLIMPHLSLPHKPHEHVDRYTASYWVGLDGFLPSSGGAVRGLWQAGVIMSVAGVNNTTPSYTGFYEWVPNDPVSVAPAQLALAPGDHLHVRLNTSDGGLRATAALANLNTSQVFEVTMEAPVSWRGPTWPAPGTSAEWIVEAGTYLNGTRYVWPDFGVARFAGARACYNTTGEECVVAGLEGGSQQVTAVLWNDTNTLYSRTVVDGGDVEIAYVEEDFTG